MLWEGDGGVGGGGGGGQIAQTKIRGQRTCHLIMIATVLAILTLVMLNIFMH